MNIINPWAILAALAVIAGSYLLGHHNGGEAREQSIRAALSKEREKAEQEAKEQRAADQQKDAAHSRELQAVRNEFDQFRANLPPPKTLVQVKEVKVSEQVTCPVVSLSRDFWLSYNAAANLQAGASKTD